MEKDRGITMISLIVTIIILIILAGISINVTVGNNGIITKTKQARENMTITQQKEAESLNKLYDELMNHETNVDSEMKEDLQNKFQNLQEEFLHFRTVIANTISVQGIETNATDSAEVMAKNIEELAKKKFEEGMAIANIEVDYQKVSRSGNSFDLKSIPNYQKLKLFENLFPIATRIYSQAHATSSVNYPNNYSYQADTGILTVSGNTGTSTKQQIIELTCYYFINPEIRPEIKSFSINSSGDSFSLKNIENYKDLTLFENLFPVTNFVYSATHDSSNVSYARLYNYDKQTGVLMQSGSTGTSTVQRISKITCYYFYNK